jgi:hypothetical protein
MKRTLVIHPLDRSTEFLSVIYDCKEWTIVSDHKSRKEMKNLIKAHDRIIMMGHGDERGLFGHDQYVINKENAYHLRTKECVFIWCNADVFIRAHRLKGLYTGMIISDWDEAIMFAIYHVNQPMIEESNTLFAGTIGKYIYWPDRLKQIKAKYTSTENPIIQFNERNIHEK